MRAMIHELFPTFLYDQAIGGAGVPKLLRELKQESLRLSEVDLEGQRWSAENYPGGYTSYGSMDQLHLFSTTFDELRKRLDRHRSKFVKALEMDINPKELSMTRLWVNVMPHGVTHAMHVHPLSVLSGTFYVQIPKGAGALKIQDPRMELFMASPPRKARAHGRNQRHHLAHPRPGQVLMFESWTRHEVPANTGRGERISISFNYDWLGE